MVISENCCIFIVPNYKVLQTIIAMLTEDKGYGLSYCNSNRKVWAVGVTLGGDKKNAFDWQKEALN